MKHKSITIIINHKICSGICKIVIEYDIYLQLNLTLWHIGKTRTLDHVLSSLSFCTHRTHISHLIAYYPLHQPLIIGHISSHAPPSFTEITPFFTAISFRSWWHSSHLFSCTPDSGQNEIEDAPIQFQSEGRVTNKQYPFLPNGF